MNPNHFQDIDTRRMAWEAKQNHRHLWSTQKPHSYKWLEMGGENGHSEPDTGPFQ